MHEHRPTEISPIVKSTETNAKLAKDSVIQVDKWDNLHTSTDETEITRTKHNYCGRRSNAEGVQWDN